MILLIENQCKGWIHNRVNTGLIKAVRTACPQKTIKLCAEAGHIQGVKELLSEDGIEIDCEEIEFDDDIKEFDTAKQAYFQQSDALIKSNSDADVIIFMSCNKGIVSSCADISEKYPDKRFYLTLHTALEEVCYSPSIDIKSNIIRILSAVKHFRKIERKDEFSMQSCMEKCKEPNCKFIIYSPMYKKELKNKLSKRIIDKIIFLHHPFYDVRAQKSNENYAGDEKIKVGIYGQALNPHAVEIVKEYNAGFDNGSVEFQVIVREHPEIAELKNVKSLFKTPYADNKDLENAINGFDYVLIPYAYNQYKVTASGIFCDAISQEKPAVMLDSPYLKYYNQYKVGILSESVKEAAEKISKLYEDREIIKKIVSSQKKLKKITFEENIYSIKKEFGEC